jgi:hypothetical protein
MPACSRGAGSRDRGDDRRLPRLLPIGLDLTRAGGLRPSWFLGRRAASRDHGRGKGIQKERVRQVLGRSQHVEHFEEATPDRGGFGATVVRLKRPE